MSILETIKGRVSLLTSIATTSIGSFGKYLWRVLIAADKLVNTLLGGKADETLSQRMGRDIAEGTCVLCKWTCKLIDLIDKGHCARASK